RRARLRGRVGPAPVRAGGGDGVSRAVPDVAPVGEPDEEKDASRSAVVRRAPARGSLRWWRSVLYATGLYARYSLIRQTPRSATGGGATPWPSPPRWRWSASPPTR